MLLDDTILRLLISAGIGLMVGIEREQTHHLAGVRTFPLFAAMGFLLSALVPEAGGWPLAGGAIALALLMGVGLVHQMRKDPASSPGITTSIAALLTYAIGAWLVRGSISVALIVGGGMAVLLHAKDALHGMAGRIGSQDTRAIARFILLALVILPVLPNRSFGPYNVINPFEVWLLVVLIVGIGLGGYVALKLTGERAGTILGGILGGVVSSTATTVGFARQAKAAPGLDRLASVVVMLASLVSLLRLIGIVAAVSPVHARTILPPLLAFAGIKTVITLAVWRGARSQTPQRQQHGNPAEILPALIFGGLYVVVSLAVAWAGSRYGAIALYPVAALSGTTDLDAITLSSARLAQAGNLLPDLAWRLIVVGVIGNLVFKAGSVWALGSRGMAIRTTVLFAIAAAGGLALLLFWR